MPFSRIAQLVLQFVTDPPSGADPVVRWRTPEDLLAAFADSVGMELTEGEPAHSEDALVAAAQTVMRYSVHTVHPRFHQPELRRAHAPWPWSATGWEPR